MTVEWPYYRASENLTWAERQIVDLRADVARLQAENARLSVLGMHAPDPHRGAGASSTFPVWITRADGTVVDLIAEPALELSAARMTAWEVSRTVTAVVHAPTEEAAGFILDGMLDDARVLLIRHKGVGGFDVSVVELAAKPVLHPCATCGGEREHVVAQDFAGEVVFCHLICPDCGDTADDLTHGELPL